MKNSELYLNGAKVISACSSFEALLNKLASKLERPDCSHWFYSHRFLSVLDAGKKALFLKSFGSLDETIPFDSRKLVSEAQPSRISTIDTTSGLSQFCPSLLNSGAQIYNSSNLTSVVKF